MLQANLPECVLISFDSALHKPEKDVCRFKLEQIGIPLSKVKEVQGFWNREPERAWLIINPTQEQQFSLIGLAWEYNQQAILHLDNQRNATLWEIDSVGNVTEQYLGRFKSVDPYVAVQQTAYTLVDQTFYCVV